ncbi:hypothetical protein PV05_04146 [Exophiala xenobiotica]|uniref:Zn(2)-C6 fungal-type domain-containing protein n=1 Tax=Exophiala xenobiotica TaxID=348802 RepID=A0A0D2DBN3_9EURO|nr:uncharacterized protein PV05_04146 [Exophiala xenobiotica]KIW59712.1 hypothetical protein PV05_04146 [Exophiala xenobiotica]
MTSTIALRQRSFSHKVRTGCLTCKKRRIKCDERKPKCGNCTRGKHTCLGYEVSKAKIFSIETTSEGDQTSRASKQTVQKSPPNLASIQPVFGTKEETQYLEHWLLSTSAMLSHYGPMGDFYTVVVPQFAWQSPAVKHMLVALSMTHAKFVRGVASASGETKSQALLHYVSAITEIRLRKLSQLQVLVAALLAWTLEMMQNNFDAALVHLKASVQLLQNYDSLQWRDGTRIVQEALRPGCMLAEGLTAIVLRKGQATKQVEPEYRDHLTLPFDGPCFTSMAEARIEICAIIESIASLTQSPAQKNTLEDIEVSLSHWLDSVRKWDQESTPSASLTGLILLFHIAMALLPEHDVAGFSYSANPAMVDFVVERASILLTIGNMREEHKVDVMESVQQVLGFVVRFFPKASSRDEAQAMLQRLCADETEMSEPNIARNPLPNLPGIVP